MTIEQDINNLYWGRRVGSFIYTPPTGTTEDKVNDYYNQVLRHEQMQPSHTPSTSEWTILEVDTTLTFNQSSGSDTVRIPLFCSSPDHVSQNIVVNWNDGTVTEVEADHNTTVIPEHTYSTEGRKIVSFRTELLGTNTVGLRYTNFSNRDRSKLTKVLSAQNDAAFYLGWNAFGGCFNVEYFPAYGNNAPLDYNISYTFSEMGDKEDLFDTMRPASFDFSMVNNAHRLFYNTDISPDWASEFIVAFANQNDNVRVDVGHQLGIYDQYTDGSDVQAALAKLTGQGWIIQAATPI